MPATATLQPAPLATTPVVQAPDEPRLLVRLGDRGEDVRQAQALLKSLGYEVEVTGLFDEATRQAVLAFQGQQGLPKDGLLGPKTRQELEDAVFWYRVARGETLWELARSFGTTVDVLKEINNLASDGIREGQRLLMPIGGFGGSSADWGRYTVRAGETLSSIAARFHVSVSQVARLNGMSDPARLRAGQQLLLPTNPDDNRHGQEEAPNLFPLSWPLPVQGRVSSPFGWRRDPFNRGGTEFHGGIDIAVASGTRVLAAASGVVVEAGPMGAYGNGVVIDHGRGVQTLYGHNARVLVQPGQWVNRGEVIALSGSSGRSTGPHLDFRVRIDGELVEPLEYVRR